MANLDLAEVERRLLENGTVVPRDPTVKFPKGYKRANDITQQKFVSSGVVHTNPHVAFLESLGRLELQELLGRYMNGRMVSASRRERKRSSESVTTSSSAASSSGSSPAAANDADAEMEAEEQAPAAARIRSRRNAEERPPGPRRRYRDVSPSEIEGVKRIPGDLVAAINQMRDPGEFFAKSQTRYLGPFDVKPTVNDLPANDEYILLQRIARLPTTQKSVFQQVGSLIT